MSRGRPPQGPKLAEQLVGSEAAKQRLAVILETLAGQRTVDEACGVLGVSETRFHELRNEWLQGAVGLLEPRPQGRPLAPPPTPAEEELAQLRRQLVEQKIQLEAANIREELALVMPHVLQPRKGAKKGGLACPAWPPRSPGAAPGTPPSSNASGGSST